MNPITFSTLACPDWSINTVITKAVEFGYQGVEWRGGPDGHIQPNSSSAEKSMLRQMSVDAGLLRLAVTAYTTFVSESAAERQSNVDELRRYADLAADLGAEYVRTFLGELPEGKNPDAIIYTRVSDCLHDAAEYAQSVGVKIAIEPHDSFVRSSTVFPLFDSNRSHPNLYVIWDLGNTFAVGEHPIEGFQFWRNHLAYVQVKDGKRDGVNWQLCRLGEGDVPLAQAFELLLAHAYQGALSVEWEYAWHPELDPPERALPEALRVARDLLVQARASQATS